MCSHNEEERRKDDLKLRLKAIAQSSGMSEEELNKYLKMVDEKQA